MTNSATLGTKTDNEKEKKIQTLIDNEDESLIIHGYKTNKAKCVITWLFYFLTIGILRLVFHWFPIWHLYGTHSKCLLSIADKILVVDKYRGKYTTYYVEKIKTLSVKEDSDLPNSSGMLTAYLENGTVIESLQIRTVSCKHVNYVWSDKAGEFIKLSGIDQNRKCSEFYEFKGLSKTEQLSRQIPYGKNETLIPVQTILSLLLLEALTPFYFFQVFSLIVWFAEKYYYYTIAIVAMSVFGISSSIIQTRRNQRTLREFHSLEKVRVRRSDGAFEEILSSNLVPGDVIQIPKSGCVVQCDAVLLNGSCVVNESMLTGESVPVTKTPIPNTDSVYDAKEDSFHTLYCGTKVIQTQCLAGDNVIAVVLRTGYLTTKGELVRSILYPPPSDFKFDQDSYKFIGILTAIAVAGFLYTVISKSDRSRAPTDILIKALDVITIVIPPALPAAMTVGKLYALGRLKLQQIFCLNSRVINVSGSVDCVCFDKTGTLTEDGLEMWGVVTVEETSLTDPTRKLETLSRNLDLIKGMATCHGIVVIEDKLLGDPLDMKVFQSTGYTILEGGNAVKYNDKVLEICHRFQFSSTLQRMSVITKDETGSYRIYCKGSPEMISKLSNSETVPANLNKQLKDFTEQGYRVIAMGTRSLGTSNDTNNMTRAEVENDLEFVGLIVLENCVKPETPGTISDLRKAKLKTIMITGDNFLTAISVAKQSGIISKAEIIAEVQFNQSEFEKPSLKFTVSNLQNINGFSQSKPNVDLENCNVNYRYAITGENWSLLEQYLPERIPEVVEKGVVFARMSGKQKQQLIQELQKLEYCVAMCGDGANDCGALKAAHVGISLSEEESSVASPFTSKVANISCVPKIIKEGRAALTTSLGVFKYMICYSLTQITSVIVLYGIDSNLTQIQFLFIDICLTLNFVSIFGKTKAYNGPLHKERPLASLLCFSCLSSMVLQMLLVIFFQIVAYKLVQTYDWFVPFQFNPENDTYYTCYENYAVFAISMFQYIILAISFSRGKPFRMPIYTNKIFFTSLLTTITICIYIAIYPANWILHILEMIIPPKLDLTIVIFALVVAHLVCSLLVEDVLVRYVFRRKMWKNIGRRLKPSNKCMNNKQNMQIPYLACYTNSKHSITFENKGRNTFSKSETGFFNESFCKTEQD